MPSPAGTAGAITPAVPLIVSPGRDLLEDREEVPAGPEATALENAVTVAVVSVPAAPGLAAGAAVIPQGVGIATTRDVSLPVLRGSETVVSLETADWLYELALAELAEVRSDSSAATALTIDLGARAPQAGLVAPLPRLSAVEMTDPKPETDPTALT